MKFTFIVSEGWKTYPRLRIKVRKRWWKFMDKFYSLIRPAFVKRVNRNEDYNCGHCGRPVLKRYLYCSEKCKEGGTYAK